MIHCLQEALTVSGMDRVAWVDCHGYDAWPALACVQAPQSKSHN